MQILPEFDDEDQRFVTSFLDVMAVVPSRGIAVCASNQYVLKTCAQPVGQLLSSANIQTFRETTKLFTEKSKKTTKILQQRI